MSCALLVVVVIILIYAYARRDVLAPRLARLMSCGCGGKQGLSAAESARTLSTLDKLMGKEDKASVEKPFIGHETGAYDPIQMGALKQTEVDAHKRSLREMTPFTYLGPSGPEKTIRDDDDILRNTGVVWLGTGGGLSALRAVASGPQMAARQLVSTSEKDIQISHRKAKTSPSWGGIIGTY